MSPTCFCSTSPSVRSTSLPREELWGVMQDLWMATKTTVLLVTHDLRESAFLANRICVMSARPGRIIEDRKVPFAHPRSIDQTYDADFVGLTQHLRSLIMEARAENRFRHCRAANTPRKEPDHVDCRHFAPPRRFDLADRGHIPVLGSRLCDLQHLRPGAAAAPARSSRRSFDLRRESGRMPYQTLYTTLVGFSLGVCIGLSLGVLIGSSRACFRHGLSAARRYFLDPESGGRADLRALVRRRHRAGDPDRDDHLHLPRSW